METRVHLVELNDYKDRTDEMLLARLKEIRIEGETLLGQYWDAEGNEEKQKNIDCKMNKIEIEKMKINAVLDARDQLLRKGYDI